MAVYCKALCCYQFEHVHEHPTLASDATFTMHGYCLQHATIACTCLLETGMRCTTCANLPHSQHHRSDNMILTNYHTKMEMVRLDAQMQSLHVSLTPTPTTSFPVHKPNANVHCLWNFGLLAASAECVGVTLPSDKNAMWNIQATRTKRVIQRHSTCYWKWFFPIKQR